MKKIVCFKIQNIPKAAFKMSQIRKYMLIQVVSNRSTQNFTNRQDILGIIQKHLQKKHAKALENRA